MEESPISPEIDALIEAVFVAELGPKAAENLPNYEAFEKEIRELRRELRREWDRNLRQITGR